MNAAVKPTTFGRYEVLAEIGRGAMGLVYKASDPMLSRLVAIKTINLNLDQADRAGYEARFTQEARAAGGLNHPNIVTIYDLGSTEDLVYIAMEYLDGQDLASIIDAVKQLPIPLALSLALQTAEALCHAHEKGIVHRDIKPANIMVLANNVAKLTDFGIARLRSQESQTQTGMRMGSPLYMSPEQVLGHRADPRSDIFSLGIVLYEMLTGRTPFGGSSMESIMYQTINIAPTTPGRVRADVPQIVDLVVERMLDKSPDNRYQTAKALADDLRECLRVIDGASLSATGSPVLGPAMQDLVRLADEKRAERPNQKGDGAPDPGPDATVPLSFLTRTPASGGATLLLSREFDSNAATQKLVQGLNSPFDRPPSGPVLGTAERHFDPAMTIDERGGPEGASPVITPAVSSSERNVSAGWPLSQREKKVSAGILGAGVLVAILILIL